MTIARHKSNRDRTGPMPGHRGKDQRGFKIGARTAMSARSWHQIKFARTRLSALQFPRFLNPPCRKEAAFTMVEIALCLGVIAFALVAIIGVLPTGIRVQRDNREDTVINQEGLLWVEAIRSGSRGLDYLTNYVDTITISNRGSANSVKVYTSPAFQSSFP